MLDLSPPAELSDVLRVIRALRVGHVVDEHELHRTVADALRVAGLAHRHEVQLAPRCRIDFVVGESIGIEIKKGKPNGRQVLEQVERYCATGRLTALVLVVQQLAPGMLSTWHWEGPAGLVEVHYIGLSKLWGIAL